MAKRKRRKYPVLPNGYGTIRHLGGNRTNPYAVHPPCVDTDENGNYKRPAALCYVDDWNAYHAGTYTPGDEIKFKQVRPMDDYAVDNFCRRLLADHTAQAFVKAEEKGKTFAEVYELFYNWKYGTNAKKKLSEQSKYSTQAAYKNCAALHNRVFEDLRHQELQDCIDSCTLRSASINNMALLIRQMYKYAMMYDLCEKDYSSGLVTPENDSKHGTPFSDEELKTLWQHKDDPVIEFILIMCYSGYRIIAYETISVDLTDWYFQGGVKTSSGKNRIVPIHSAIQPLVAARVRRYGRVMENNAKEYRESMYEALSALGMAKHKPHDCRHTFSRLCEKYGVNENDRKRMLGHSFGADITNGIYGHRTLDELRTEIEKIKAPCL